MKIMKKLSAVLLSLCLTLPCFSLVAYAAGGSVTFTDPESSVGSEVEVTCALRADTTVGEFDVSLAYDEASLQFVSAEGADVEASGGTLKCTGDAGNEGSEGVYRFQMKFKSLKEGTTKITVSESDVKTSDGDSVEGREGTSTIKIAAGANGETEVKADDSSGTSESGTAAGTVEIDGKQYTANTISDVMIPTGFVKEDLSYNDTTIPAMKNETSGDYIVNLKEAEAGESLYLYDSKENEFIRCEQINITADSYIFILDKMKETKVPSGYEEITFTFNEKDFPAWQDTKNTDKADLYLIYALNSVGKRGFYQYDNVDGTYQRYTVSQETEKKDTSSGIFGKISDFVQKNSFLAAIAAIVIVAVVLIVIIMLAVKLRRRNQELDDLYDEMDGKKGKGKYTAPKAAKSEKAQFRKREKESDDWEDDWSGDNDNNWDDEEDEDDWADDDYDEKDYDDDDYEDYDEDVDTDDWDDEEDDSWDEEDYDGGDDWDDEDDDFDSFSAKSSAGSKSRKQEKESGELDEYLDFLDLDD